jgi:F-box domain
MNPSAMSRKRPHPSTSKIRRDPFNEANLPLNVIEEIISYLPVKDVLNCCLVSEQWNSIVGNSRKFKKNVALKIRAWEENLDISRTYESIRVVNLSTIEEMEGLLCNDIRMKWKYVTLTLRNGISLSDFIKFINAINAFRELRELTILKAGIREHWNSNLISPLRFLETLTLSDVTFYIFKTLVVSYPNLKNLSIGIISAGSFSIPSDSIAIKIAEFLDLNPTIQNLDLKWMIIEDLFAVELDLPQLQLRNMKIGIDSLRRKNTLTNLSSFLRSQSEHLEKFELSVDQLQILGYAACIT